MNEIDREVDREMRGVLGELAPSAGFEEELLSVIRERTMHKRIRPVMRIAGKAIAAAVALAATGVAADVMIHQDAGNNAVTKRLVAVGGGGGGASAMEKIGDFFAFRNGRMPPAPPEQVLVLDAAAAMKTQFGWIPQRYSARAEIQAGAGEARAGEVSEPRYRDAARIMDEKNAPNEEKRAIADQVAGTLRKRVDVQNTEQFGKASACSLVVQNGGEVEKIQGAEIVVGVPVHPYQTGSTDGPVVGAGAGPVAFRSMDAVDGQRVSGQGGQEDRKSGGEKFEKATEELGRGEIEGNKMASFGSVGVALGTTDAEKVTPPSFHLSEVTVGQTTETSNGMVVTRGNGTLVADAGDGRSGNGVAAQSNTPATPQSGVATPRAQEVVQEVAVRKVIRNGEVEFEVRSFDDAYQTIVSVVEEEKGYVSSTSSSKLANGKIAGEVVVRVLPERLDRLLLKLRALGELKSQQIAASDVTKQYTDIESELKALRAMEARLIDLVKNGKGEVKDLVVAEKQLGEYRVRIEKLEGEIRYYNNLVGMATLTIRAYEKDIQKPTAAFEQENVTLGIETEDVEGKYKDARAIVQEAKGGGGRIVESELKKYDADQYSARIVADVPAEKADFVAGQLKQLGKAATFNRDRRQVATGGTGAPTVQVEQKDTRFVITLYNLANVAPRETAVMTVAVKDVEGSFRVVLDLVRTGVLSAPGMPVDVNEQRMKDAKAIGRIVTSNISGQQPEQMTADIRADVRTENASTVLAAIRDMGEVVVSTSTENPDTANVTTAKRGIQLRLVNVAAVPARETRTMRLVAGNVPEAYGKLLGALVEQGGVRVVASQLNEMDPQKGGGVSASLSFEAKREALPAVEKAFADAGVDYLSRSIVRSSDTANTLDTKVRFQIDELVMSDLLPPRQTTVLGIEVGDVGKSLASVRGALPREGGVKEVEYTLTKDASGRVTGHLVVDVPVRDVMAVLTKISDLGGTEKVNQVTKNASGVGSEGEKRFIKERIDLSLTNPAGIVKSDAGLLATVKSALSAAVGALLYSVYLIIVGVLFVGPFLLVGWGGWKVMRRKKA